MWEWNDALFIRRPLDDHPAIAAFAAGLSLNEARTDLDISRSILKPLGLRGLPLLEWTLSEDAPALFDTLCAAGSRQGLFLDHPRAPSWEGEMLQCDVTSRTADAVAQQRLLDYAAIFVDDRQQCAVVSWYGDFNVLCLSPDLFDRYLRRQKPVLALDGQGPAALDFRHALEGAFSRIQEWNEGRPGADNSVIEDFAWQR